MWLRCSPVTYKGTSSTAAGPRFSIDDYQAAVLKSYRPSREGESRDDLYSAACLRRDSDYLARGRQVLDVHDTVFTAYADYARATGKAAEMQPQQLPPPRR